MAVDVSVVISTYNRCTLLAKALQALLWQTAGEITYEILVVDNNSSDETRDLLQTLTAKNQEKLRYIFEPQQGLSYGRNTGIASARAPIIAFTDDDVCVASDWIAQIKAVFDADPSIDFLGGKVLPQWEAGPPAWLTRVHWAPLALVDYGDQPFYVDIERQCALIGANLAFRRRAFELVGLFKTDFQRVKKSIGSLEDHEMLLRLWYAGRRGMYLPQLLVTGAVEPDRLQKNYHRRWHAGHGYFYALLRTEEEERSQRGRFLGVPAHLYRRALSHGARWIVCKLQNRSEQAFEHEIRLHFFGGFVRKRWRDFFSFHGRPATPCHPAE
jgi:glycosyltransferase involved in cell wall biosynthesis